MSPVVSLVWASTVLFGFWRHRPLPERVRLLVPAVTRRPRFSVRTRRLVAAGLATAAAWFVLPAAAPVAGVAAWGVPVWRARRQGRVAGSEVWRTMPEVVDLFAVAVGAGLTVPLAVRAVGRRGGGRIGASLRDASDAMRAGRRCGDALDDVARDLGPEARPLFDALVASERYGASLADALVRIAGEVRADRRRRAEEAARRVPVKLLFPLVLCVLPAFALLTVAPLLAGTYGSLRH